MPDKKIKIILLIAGVLIVAFIVLSPLALRGVPESHIEGNVPQGEEFGDSRSHTGN